MKRALPSHSQPFPYETRSKYPLNDTMRELTQVPNRAIVDNPHKVSPPGMGYATRVGKVGVVKERRIYLSLNPDNGANPKYTGDERSDTNDVRRGKRYRRKMKSDRSSRGEET